MTKRGNMWSRVEEEEDEQITAETK